MLTDAFNCESSHFIRWYSVDDEASRFFDKNLRFLPIFDKRIRPNDCHTASPFLFWTIVVIGSRRYTKDPTLILILAPKVLNLAKNAIFSSERALATIQALLILCTWQMPIDTLQKDITPQLAGAMLQLATNIGLHVYGSVQDFSRIPLRYDTEQRSFRTRLWAVCLWTSQRYAPAIALILTLIVVEESTTAEASLP